MNSINLKVVLWVNPSKKFISWEGFFCGSFEGGDGGD